MRSYFVLICICLNVGNVLGQTVKVSPNNLVQTRFKNTSKLVVDSSVISSWESIGYDGEVRISDDGRYISYSINKGVSGFRSMVIQSTDDSFKREFVNGDPISFSSDSKQFAFKVKDTLCLLDLRSNIINYVVNVSSVKEPPAQIGEWIGWKINNEVKELVIKNRITGSEKHYSNVVDYTFNANGSVLLLKILNKNEGATKLQWINLKMGNVNEIFFAVNSLISNESFDLEGKQLVFTTSTKYGDSLSNSIWYYREGLPGAILKVNDSISRTREGLFIKSASFNGDGKYIFITAEKIEFRKPDPNAVKVNIWNYQDVELQSLQIKSPRGPRKYLSVMLANDNASGSIIQLNRGIEEVTIPKMGDYALITQYAFDKGDRQWLDNKPSTWLISLKNGKRDFFRNERDIFFSPTGRFLIYFDTLSQNYFSYEILTKKLKNISYSLPKGLLLYDNEFYIERKKSSVRIGWLKGDAGLLVSDNFDIWLLDPIGVQKAINLTNGYGARHKIKFWVLDENKSRDGIEQNEKLLLTAFNIQTKFNGFYKISLSGEKVSDPQLLTMGPFMYYIRYFLLNEGMVPLKARKSEIWVVRRCSYNEAPNYYLTGDFKSYKAVTDIKPHVNLNWVTAELVKFRQLDGTTSQGILYKPRDFDSQKKYPLIINYYEQMSNHLFDFPQPHFIGDAFLNIPWFVSRGYLVFLPDIYFVNHGVNNGESACNTVISAAKYLAKREYVNPLKMAVAGHSFAGGLTNYIVTHSNIFAAAFEGAGVSNLISSALQLNGNGSSRMISSGTTQNYPLLWGNLDKWISGSPIFRADKVSTPLLMFHCRADGAVPWEQAVEFFVALRRLNKKVWLLEYDDGNHGVFGKNAQDLTKRVTQFFDYYLKEATPPAWMTKGVPAGLKGIDNGFQSDLSGFENDVKSK